MLGLLYNKWSQIDNFYSVFLTHNHYLLAEPSTKAADAAATSQSVVLTGEYRSLLMCYQSKLSFN